MFGVPCQVTLPVSARRMSSTIRIEVVLPAPLAPSRPKMRPGSTSKLTPSSAWMAPNRLETVSTTRLMTTA